MQTIIGTSLFGVVVKDIPTNSIAVGNPAKVIKTLTQEDKKADNDAQIPILASGALRNLFR